MLLCLAMPLCAYAETYTFNNGSINIEIGNDVKTYTQNSDISGVPDIGTAPEDFELLVYSDELKYYWFFYHLANNSIADFASMEDDAILKLIENDSTDIEVENVSSEVYNNGKKYLLIDSYNKDTDEYIHYYVTGVGNALYYFVAPSKGSELTDPQKADLRSVIDAVTYVKQEAPSEHEQRQAALIRVLKRFGIAFGALAIFVVIKLAVEKIRKR